MKLVGMFTLCRGGGSTLALVGQNIVRYTSMLDWKKDWYGGIDYGMDYGIYSNTQLYCVAICLLTFS